MPLQAITAVAPHLGPALGFMFEARKRVFVDLLKWDVPVFEDRYEIDQFDKPGAAYLVLTGEEVGHRASTRLLRTDGPHILGNLFPFLCEGPTPSGPTTREITRFCIEPTLPRGQRRDARNELVTSLVRHALQCGITDYTAVANVAWYRQIAEFGWKCAALGPLRQTDNETLVALHIRIDAATPDDLAATGIWTPARFDVIAAGDIQ